MKTRRAKFHLEALESGIAAWQNHEPYRLFEQDNLEEGWHFFIIRVTAIDESVPMLAGDFVCCLRSALDQLAWNLAHLDPARVFTEREQRVIAFPTASPQDTNYAQRRTLFPAAIADAIDLFQPNTRGSAYKDHPLWQLNELWILDKHRTIPANCNNIKIDFSPTDRCRNESFSC